MLTCELERTLANLSLDSSPAVFKTVCGLRKPKCLAQGRLLMTSITARVDRGN
jgi:hypothetical protein